MRKEIDGVNNVSLFFRNPHPPTIRDSEKKGLKKIMHPFSRLAFMNIEKKKMDFLWDSKKVLYRLIDVILYYSDYNSVFFVFLSLTTY